MMLLGVITGGMFVNKVRRYFESSNRTYQK